MDGSLEPAAGLRRRLRAVGQVLEVAPAHVVALLVLGSCACAGLVALWWSARPAGLRPAPTAAASGAPVAGEPVPPDGGAPSGAPAGVIATPAASQVVVHVSGAVANPGVVTLPGGARVDDAVAAAGGATGRARTDQLNLARPLRDGEQIHVPGSDEAGPAPAGGAAGTEVDGGPGGTGVAERVNLNHADAAALEELPDVGPVLAERIIAYREANGGFRDVAELQQVPGIGEKTFAALEDLVTV